MEYNEQKQERVILRLIWKVQRIWARANLMNSKLP